MIKLLVMRVQACFNIPQALPVRKLGIGKAEKLIITGELSDSAIALVFFNELVKLIDSPYFCNNPIFILRCARSRAWGLV